MNSEESNPSRLRASGELCNSLQGGTEHQLRPQGSGEYQPRLQGSAGHPSKILGSGEYQPRFQGRTEHQSRTHGRGDYQSKPQRKTHQSTYLVSGEYQPRLKGSIENQTRPVYSGENQPRRHSGTVHQSGTQGGQKYQHKPQGDTIHELPEGAGRYQHRLLGGAEYQSKASHSLKDTTQTVTNSNQMGRYEGGSADLITPPALPWPGLQTCLTGPQTSTAANKKMNQQDIKKIKVFLPSKAKENCSVLCEFCDKPFRVIDSNGNCWQTPTLIGSFQCPSILY